MLTQCVVVCCDKFHATEHIHFIGFLIETEEAVIEGSGNNKEVIRMLLSHSKTVVIYQPCNNAV